MENIKRYYGADASDKVLPWIFYRIVEAEQFNGSLNVEYVKPEYKSNYICKCDK